MPKFFKATNNKIEKIWNENELISSNINNFLKKITVNLNSTSFTKKITHIPLITKYPALVNSLPSASILGFSTIISFPYFPDWAIRSTSIVPIFSLDDGNQFNIKDLLITYKVSHLWKKIKENSYELQIVVIAIGDIFEGLGVQFYLDMNLYIMNEKRFTTIDKSHV